MDTAIKLIRAAEVLMSRFSFLITPSGLTASQFGVLEVLLHLGPQCQSDLGRKLLKTSGNITLVVDNLEKRGLVRRKRGEGDRRFVTVCLTLEGERLIRELFPRYVEGMVQEMRLLTADEQEELGRLCRKLGKGLAQRGASAIPRIQ